MIRFRIFGDGKSNADVTEHMIEHFHCIFAETQTYFSLRYLCFLVAQTFYELWICFIVFGYFF